MHRENNYSDIYQKMKQAFPDLVMACDEPMSSHTTFKVGGPADIYLEPSRDLLVPVLDFLNQHQVPVTVIGNGSNLLVSDAGIEGAVLSFGKNDSDIEIVGNQIKVQAGAMLSTLANAAAKASLSGLEFAAGIPGSVGGAVYMNAGAYGGEMKNVVASVRVLTKRLQIIEITGPELDLSYRHSIIMDIGGIIVDATLELTPGRQEDILAVMEENKAKRIEKQPLNFPSAGSTFKRPEGYFAGKLIEDAGLRGYTVGGAQVSEKHCGFVVNKGGAKACDIMQLMSDVDEKVFEKFGVHMEPEVRIIGRDI